jgi:ankyrin repeat protein
MLASFNNHIECVKLLLEASTNPAALVNERDSTGQTSLHKVPFSFHKRETYRKRCY